MFHIRSKCIILKLNINAFKHIQDFCRIIEISMSLKSANLSMFLILEKKNACFYLFAEISLYEHNEGTIFLLNTLVRTL